MSYRRFSSQNPSISDSTIADIRLQAAQGLSQSQIADNTGVHRKTVYDVLANRTWNHVPEPVRAYGFPNYLIMPDGRVFSTASEQFIKSTMRSDGTPVVRIRNSGGNRVTVPVSTLVARGYMGTRSRNPQVTFRDGNPQNTHFTNITLA
jgi:hypothetical protein